MVITYPGAPASAETSGTSLHTEPVGATQGAPLALPLVSAPTCHDGCGQISEMPPREARLPG